jgi:hypothetical protein
MSTSQNITPLRKQDYEAIEQAVMETARGRWFLHEYAHRNRNADTNMLLRAIERIEDALALKSLGENAATPDLTPEDLSGVIANTRHKISTIRDDLLDDNCVTGDAADPLDATAASADAISVSIFEQARELQETVYKLRDAGTHQILCDALDDCAAQLMQISQKQDLNARRITQALRALQKLDEKISGPSQSEEIPDASPMAQNSNVPVASEEAIVDAGDDSANDDHIVFVQTRDSGNPPHFDSESISTQPNEHPAPVEASSDKPLVFIPA